MLKENKEEKDKRVWKKRWGFILRCHLFITSTIIPTIFW